MIFKFIMYIIDIESQEPLCPTYKWRIYTGGKEKYFRDLFNYDVFCLQHGLTIQDIPNLQNRLKEAESEE